jgi:hypothetical protein
MLAPTPLFEVWSSSGFGLIPGPRFRRLEDARRYVAAHKTEASFAIRSPEGTWESIVSRPPRHSRELQIQRRTA